MEVSKGAAGELYIDFIKLFKNDVNVNGPVKIGPVMLESREFESISLDARLVQSLFDGIVDSYIETYYNGLNKDVKDEI